MQYYDIDSIHSVLLGILKYFDAFCRRNGLRYSLSGGTMIGAVRHKGFIPWDDDADIMMPRPDYDKFLQLFNGQSDGRYYALSRESSKDHHYINCYAKVEDSTTVSVEHGLRGIAKFGLNIDVFPVDGAPEDPAERKRFCDRILHYRRRLVLRQRPFSRLFEGPPLAWFQAHARSIQYWLDRIDDIIRTYPFNDSKFTGAVCGLHGTKEVHPREVFDNYTDYQFEDATLMGIKDAHAYLTAIFGDYMQLPPESERGGKHRLQVMNK